MKKLISVILILCITNVLSAPIVLTVGPVTDVDCDFNTVFDAVNSGNINMDIRISNELITTSGVFITDVDVSSLSGGYFSCADAANNIIDAINPYSEISNLNAGKALHIAFFVDIEHTINLTGLKIHNSNGGVSIVSGGTNTNLTVNMDAVDIYDNIFYGIKTSGAAIVINYDHGRIEHNTDADKGGGLECYDGEVHFGEDVKIKNNSAFLGGGIYASKCTIYLLAGDSNPLAQMEYGVVKNQAQDAGAGVYLSESTLLGVDINTHPISISGNTVTSDSIDGRGAGVFMTSASGLSIGNARIDDNIAIVSGAAIAAIHNDNTLATPAFILARDVAGCSFAETCVSVSGNSVTSNASSAAAILHQGGGYGYISHAKLQNNSGLTASSVFKAKNSSQLVFASDLITNNTSQNNLFDQLDQTFLSVRYSTLADNNVLNYFAVQYDNNNPQTLEVDTSIIKNGTATVAFLDNDNGNHDAQVKCSLVETDDTTGVVQNQSVIALPHFVGNGNYKLLLDSPAIDSNCASFMVNDLATLDVRGQLRADDGTPDLGAYEFISSDDVIFKNSFEGGL